MFTVMIAVVVPDTNSIKWWAGGYAGAGPFIFAIVSSRNPTSSPNIHKHKHNVDAIFDSPPYPLNGNKLLSSHGLCLTVSIPRLTFPTRAPFRTLLQVPHRMSHESRRRRTLSVRGGATLCMDSLSNMSGHESVVMFGPAKYEDEEDSCESRYTMILARRSTRVWKRTRFRGISTDRGLLSAISLAENSSEVAMKLPPREVIDQIKLILETDAEPQWYKVFC